MRILTFMLFGSLLFSCENNPYPSEGDLRTGERNANTYVPPGLGMIVDKEYEFYEGTSNSFKIKVTVPSPGTPDVEVEGLPAGAKFDPKTMSVTWMPGAFDGNDPSDATIKTRIYPITVWLRSSITDEDGHVTRSIEAIDKLVILKVYDVQRNLEIYGRDFSVVNEGNTYEYDFEIINPDYPNGPFSIVRDGVPGNTEMEQLSETQFRLKFTPDNHHVKINENDECTSDYDNCVIYNAKISVFNPAKHKIDKNFQIKIHDTRLDTRIVAPEKMEQGLDISFQVSAYDLNAEVAPKIKLSSPEPEYGVFKQVIVKDEENNSSVLNISWKDIPPSHNGKEFNFSFSACSLATNKTYTNCNLAETNVKIIVKDRSAPLIDRSSWKAGEIKYFNFNKRNTFNIDVTDGDNVFDRVRNIKVMPSEMRKYVSFRNGVLKTRFNKPGIHQFSLVAKSEYNMSSAESFVAEVFPKGRSRTLYFTDSTRDAEVKFYRDTMGKAQLMNPVLQPLNERNLSGRDTLILGTGILQDTDLKLDIKRAMDKIRNVVIASPLIGNMPTSFIDELQQEFHISILGRYLELPNTSKLSEMSFIARKDFEVSSKKVGLLEKSTIESNNPLIFSVGVDRVNCEDVLDLTDPNKDARLKIGIICDRKYGGRYAILGTEFSDLKGSKKDKDIPAKWLQRMLNTNLNNNKKNEVK